jgi:hypothetical protein
MKSLPVVGYFILRTALFAVIFVSLANAQASRTWVSGVGDDVNPCSRTAPCKTFAGAISKTAAGGEINCLDPGGFGAVTITKAITIDCGGTFGSVLVSGTNGIVISAATSDVVNLRHLEVNGIGAGLTGILYNSARAVHIEDVNIYNFTVAGVAANVSAVSLLTLENLTITECGTDGISLNANAGNLQADINHVRVSGVTNGLNGLSNSIINARNSNFAFIVNGVAQGAGSSITLVGNQFSNNFNAVISHGGSSISVYSNTFGSNNTALNPNGGTIFTDIQNGSVGNASNGLANGGAATKI